MPHKETFHTSMIVKQEYYITNHHNNDLII